MPAVVRPEEGAVFDFSARTKLRITGADRLRYLNGQISNDLRKATSTAAIHACVLTAKGRINADVFIAVDGESFLVDAEAETRESLPARLDRYIIADDVQIEDVTEKFALFHVLGREIPAVTDTARRVSADRFGFPGMDIWLERGEHDRALQMFAARLGVCTDEAAETFRIERGVPRWGRELTEDIIPIEANLEERTVDYAKGCYIGQEVISRMKMSGQTNKRLCGLVPIDGTLRESMRLIGADSKDAGWITSVTESARLGKQIALGFVKRGFGPELIASAEATPPVRVQLAALPFA